MFPNTEFFSGPYFPEFGLNTEIYSVNLRIQSEYRKNSEKKPTFGHFSRVFLKMKLFITRNTVTNTLTPMSIAQIK